MNTHFVRGVALALCTVGLLTACSKIGDTPSHPQKEIADYTIILYGTGGGDLNRNNELDLALYKNLAEVRNTEYTPKVNFTALVRFSVAVSAMEGIGATRYDWLPTTLTSTGGMLLEQNNVRPLDFFMTYAPNITDFINEAVETYPARKYILIAWNHGGGFEPEDVYVPDLELSTRACMSDYGVIFDGLDAPLEEHLSIFEFEEALRSTNLVKGGLSIVMCGPTTYQGCLSVDGEEMPAYSYQHNYPHTRFDQIAHWSTLLSTGAPEDETVPSHFDLHERGVDGIVDFYSSFTGDCCLELVGDFVFDTPALAELYAREYEAEDLECEREGNKLKVYFSTLALFYNRYDVSQLIARLLKRFELGPSISFGQPFASITGSSTICYTAHFLQETCTKCYAEIGLGSPAEASEVLSLFGNKTNFNYGFYDSDSYVRFDITAEVKGKDKQATLATCADIADKQWM